MENETKDKSLSDERSYTKKQLESIIEKRLKREREAGGAIIAARNALSAIRKEKAFRDLSNRELAKKLAALADGLSDDNTRTHSAKPSPTHPDASEKDKDDASYAELSTEKTEEAIDPEKKEREDEIREFISLYGEEKLKELTTDRSFKSFCRNRVGDLTSLYEDYFIFLEGLKNTRKSNSTRAAQRGIASTGFSGYAAGTPDYASLLTENQKQIAQEAGMSYKQYATLLSQIPTKKLGK